MEKDSNEDDDDEMKILYHVREMSLAPAEDGRQRMKRILMQKLNNKSSKT